MSPAAYRAMLIRKIEQERGRVHSENSAYDVGRADALDHVLWLIKDIEDL